jgi:hypothetical protein
MKTESFSINYFCFACGLRLAASGLPPRHLCVLLRKVCALSDLLPYAENILNSGMINSIYTEFNDSSRQEQSTPVSRTIA